MNLDLARLADGAAAIACDAAGAILEVYEAGFTVEHKDDRSPVTAADLAAHRLISAGLARLAPDIPVLSEEAATIPWDERRQWPRYWLVDPLDGTREFIKRNGEFSVNIALVEDHCPVLGVIQAPVSGDLVLAWKGGGSWRVQGRTRSRLQVRPASEPLLAAGSRSHGNVREEAMLGRLGAWDKRPLGSSLKFIAVAAGEADLYLRLGQTSEWDTAAGQCLLEEAGGAVRDLSGQPLRYNAGESLINPEFLASGDPAVDWSLLFAP